MLFTLYLIKLNWMFAWHLPLCTRLYSDGRKQIEKPWKFREQRLTNWLDLGTSASPDPAFLLWSFGGGFASSSPQHIFWFVWERLKWVQTSALHHPRGVVPPGFRTCALSPRLISVAGFSIICPMSASEPKESFLPQVSQQAIFLFYLQECPCLHCFPQQDCLPLN